MWQSIRQWWQRVIERGRPPVLPDIHLPPLPTTAEMEEHRKSKPADGGAKIKMKHKNIKGPRTD